MVASLGLIAASPRTLFLLICLRLPSYRPFDFAQGPDALKYANQAVDLTKPGTNAGDAARKEKDRLVQLIGGISEPPAK